MRCAEFRDFYSDFRDALITDPALAGRLERHLSLCAGCAQFHNSVEQGVELLRFSADLEPSPDFRRRLRRRLATASTDPDPVLPAPAGLAAAMMFVAALGILVYEGFEHGVTADAHVAAAVPAGSAARRTAPVLAAPAFQAVAEQPPAVTDLVFPAFGETGVHFTGASASPSPGFEATLTGFDGSR